MVYSFGFPPISLCYCLVLVSYCRFTLLSTNSKSPTYDSSSCELSKMLTCVPSVSGISEIAAFSPSPLADDLSASSTICHLLSLLQSITPPPAYSMPAPVCQLLYCTTILFKVLYYKIKNVFLCIICVKSIINLLYSTVLYS